MCVYNRHARIGTCKQFYWPSTNKETVVSYPNMLVGSCSMLATDTADYDDIEPEMEESSLGRRSEFGLAWDSRRGRWISLVYRYVFPKSPFQFGEQLRPGRFEFGPCKHHHMTISQSPFTRRITNLASIGKKRRHQPAASRQQYHDTTELLSMCDDQSLLDDFLSSAVIDGQSGYGYGGEEEFGIPSIGVMPSSPPPPLFLDGSCPIPDLNASSPVHALNYSSYY